MSDASVISRERTELYVGLFVAVGLAIMGTLIWNFSGIRDSMVPRYNLYVLLPDASGVLDGGAVKFRGTKIGFVKEKRFMDDLSGVLVTLDIFQKYEVPEESQFTIVTSGLMGDRYIDIVPPDRLTGRMIKPNTPNNPIDNTGADLMTELKKRAAMLADKMDTVLDELDLVVKESRSVVSNLNSVTEKIDQQVMSEENIGNVSKTIEKLRASTDNLATATEQLEPLLQASQETVVAAAKPFERMDAAIVKLEPALDDLRATVRNANLVMADIKNGEGVAGAILSDSKLRADLTSFVENLEAHGILGYKKGKKASDAEEKAAATKTPSKPAAKPEAKPSEPRKGPFRIFR